MIDAIDAIIDLYGHRDGLTVIDNTIVSWPYDEPQPTRQELDNIISNYQSNAGNRQKMNMEILSSKDDILLSLMEFLCFADSTKLEAMEIKIQSIKDKYQ